jgi:hypothetical protein
MSRILGIALIAVGVFLVTSFLIHSAWLLLGLALLFGLGASTGWIGRAGYGVAAVLAVLGLAGAFFGAVAWIVRWAPLLLVIFGLYFLLGKPRRG